MTSLAPCTHCDSFSQSESMLSAIALSLFYSETPSLMYPPHSKSFLWPCLWGDLNKFVSVVPTLPSSEQNSYHTTNTLRSSKRQDIYFDIFLSTSALYRETLYTLLWSSKLWVLDQCLSPTLLVLVVAKPHVWQYMIFMQATCCLLN